MTSQLYLKNAWYAAGWESDLTDAPKAIQIMDEHLVIYRGEAGAIVAMDDRCPHRFAPLSLGEVRDGQIMCRYHGLRFDGTGQCVHNPWGKDGKAPGAARVRTYPIALKYGMIWLWMGDAAKADEASLPTVPFMEDANFALVHGYLKVPTHYELVIDNLLDLTHASLLHPFLASEESTTRTTIRFEHDESRISAFYDVRDEPITGLFQLFYRGTEATAPLRSYIHWSAPSNLWLDVGIKPADVPEAEQPAVPTAHWLTPETENSTHYFWAGGRNCQRDNAEIGAMMQGGIGAAFENEDEPMIRAARSRMSSNDLFAEKPLLLPTDEAGVLARRRLAKMIAAEAGA